MPKVSIIRSSDETAQQRIDRTRTLDLEIERKKEIYCVTVEIPWYTADEDSCDYYNSSEIEIEDEESLSNAERAEVRAKVKEAMKRDNIHDEA